VKHSIGFPLDTPEEAAITQALDMATEDLRGGDPSRELPMLSAAVMRDDEHTEAGEYLVVVRDR
jgi:hypothetical protein